MRSQERESELCRRISRRRSFATDACLFDESGEPVVLETVDLGEGGIFVLSELLLEPGEELWVSFRLPSGPKLVVRGRVVHGQLGSKSLPPGMGIEFLDLSDRERGSIGVYLEQGSNESNSWSAFSSGFDASAFPHDPIIY